MTTGYWYTNEELLGFGFSSVGPGTRISRQARLYNIVGSVGDNVRVDDFVVLKGSITIGSHVHVASFTCLAGGSEGIVLSDFSGVSTHCSFFTASDSYTQSALHFLAPARFRCVREGAIFVGEGAIVGAGCVVLPGSSIGHGASLAAGCAGFGDVPDGGIVSGSGGRWNVTRYRDAEAIRAMVRRAREEA